MLWLNAWDNQLIWGKKFTSAHPEVLVHDCSSGCFGACSNTGHHVGTCGRGELLISGDQEAQREGRGPGSQSLLKAHPPVLIFFLAMAKYLIETTWRRKEGFILTHILRVKSIHHAGDSTMWPGWSRGIRGQEAEWEINAGHSAHFFFFIQSSIPA